MIFVLLCIGLSMMHACSAAQSPLKDIRAIKTTIMENHPGWLNEEDEGFIRNLETAYQKALYKLIRHPKDSEYRSILQEFVTSFDDCHLSIRWNNRQKQSDDIPQRLDSLSIRSQNITPTSLWISFPSCDPGVINKQLFKETIAQLSNQQYKNIIFDLRGNCGGNSSYGTTLVDALFGKHYADHQRWKYNHQTYIDWRVSQGNLHHLKDLFEHRDDSWPEECVDWITSIIEGIEDCLNRNRPFYREFFHESCTNPTCDESLLKHDLAASIWVIIDHHNASAALDFIDELKQMDYPITLVGEQTQADRLYMEVRSVALPSTIGFLNFPIKVYRNRMRRDHEPYQPDIFINTSISPEEIYKFIAQQIPS